MRPERLRQHEYALNGERGRELLAATVELDADLQLVESDYAEGRERGRFGRRDLEIR